MPQPSSPSSALHQCCVSLAGAMRAPLTMNSLLPVPLLTLSRPLTEPASAPCRGEPFLRSGLCVCVRHRPSGLAGSRRCTSM